MAKKKSKINFIQQFLLFFFVITCITFFTEVVKIYLEKNSEEPMNNQIGINATKSS